MLTPNKNVVVMFMLLFIFKFFSQGGLTIIAHFRRAPGMQPEGFACPSLVLCTQAALQTGHVIATDV